MLNYTALVTVLAVVLYFYTGLHGRQGARQIRRQPPATTGNVDFERVFRVQMNTLEWMPIFLPLLWLFAFYVRDWGCRRARPSLAGRPGPLHPGLCAAPPKIATAASWSRRSPPARC